MKTVIILESEAMQSSLDMPLLGTMTQATAFHTRPFWLTFLLMAVVPFAACTQLIAQAISSIDPSSAAPDAQVTIQGSNFGPTNGSVLFGTAAATVSDWQATSIKVKVPDVAVGTSKVVVITAGGSKSSDFPYSIVSAASECGSDKSQMAMRQIISADFCQQDNNCNCAGLLVPVSPNATCKPPDNSPNPANPPSLNTLNAFVEDTGHVQYKATVNSVGVDKLDISFCAPSGFRPAAVGVDSGKGPFHYAFAPAVQIQTSDLVYSGDDLEQVCMLDANKQPNCAKTTSANVVLQPIAEGSPYSTKAVLEEIQTVTVQGAGIQLRKGTLLVARVTAPVGLEPVALVAKNTDLGTSVVVRRTIKPGQNNNDLQVELSIVDQETAERNYGSRTAKRYFAVNLDVRNPTDKKLQFRKSAMYFDVDYARAESKGGGYDFKYAVLGVASFGLYVPSSYQSKWKPTSPPQVYRFGLEQNVQQSPLNYMAVLGSYDETTERQNRNFQFVQLLASMAATIASGGYVADKSNTAFVDATSLLSGVFLPSLKGIIINVDGINRRRANLVAQTLQDTIQIAPRSSASTIVLLPRYGILAFTDADVSVVIDRIRDVHLVTEVVTEVTETPVVKGSCRDGYTKDQARQALGEPTASSTADDGTSTFTYNTGPVASVAFSKQGLVSTCQSRPIADQLAAAATLVDAKQVLAANSLTYTTIALVDGTTMLVDVPGVNKQFHYDANGKITTDYTLLFSAIQTEAASKPIRSAFEQWLEGKALNKSTAEIITSYATANASKTTVDYPSPDIQGGTLQVEYDKAGKDGTITDGKVVFKGPQPPKSDAATSAKPATTPAAAVQNNATQQPQPATQPKSQTQKPKQAAKTTQPKPATSP